MSETRFVAIGTVVEVQTGSEDAALKLAKKYVNIDTGPGDTVNIVEDKTRFSDITEDYIYYETIDFHDISEDDWDEEFPDISASSFYDPLIRFNEDNFDNDNGRTYFDVDEELRIAQEDAEADKAIISALAQAHRDTKEYQE